MTPTGRMARCLLDDDFLVLVNSWSEPLELRPARTRSDAQWRAEIDSYDPAAAEAAKCRAGDRVTVGARSITVLRSPMSTIRAGDP